MDDRPDEICARPEQLPPLPCQPQATPIYPTSVWRCSSTEQAEQLLGGELDGYVYQRDGHPNADVLCEKIRDLHAGGRAMAFSSGMAALAAALLSQARQGDHLVVSSQLYGRSSLLLEQEAERLGISHTTVDPCDLSAVEAAMRDNTRLVVVETLSNPCLRCVDIAALAERAHRRGALLLVDNTFATPVLCQPLRLGADLVMESVSKMINGHSDVMLGVLCGAAETWERVPLVTSAWGLASSPLDCWLAARGLATLALRMERACGNAQAAAEFLQAQPQVKRVDYPGLPGHPDHDLAARQCGQRFGPVVTFHLAGRETADRFISAAADAGIPFCPSLGEISTTLSHPASTSHRLLAPEQRQQLGMDEGTIRLSLGIESPAAVVERLRQALRG